MPGDSVRSKFVGLAAPGAHRAGAGGWPCQGIYYTPADRRPATALIATHYNVDFSQHYLAEYVAALGVGFLGWNTRYRGDEAHFLLDHALVDIGVGVRWLREQMGVEHVVLLGNSGGGSLMAAYQSQAVTPNVTPVRGMRPAAGLDELPPCDAYVSLAAHPGRPVAQTNCMDAAVLDEADIARTDPDLDLWNPKNGPPYSPEFLERYRAAQIARNERITAWAHAELDRLNAAGISDRLFSIARTFADPRMVDPTIDPNRRRPNWTYQGEPRRANYASWGVGGSSTLRTWISMFSLADSQCTAEPHLARITVPSLVISADADTGVYPSDAKAIFTSLGAGDKTFHEMPGDHYFIEPVNTRPEVAQLIVGWLAERLPVG